MSTPLSVLVARLESELELAHLALVADEPFAAGVYVDQARKLAEQLRGGL